MKKTLYLFTFAVLFNFQSIVYSEESILKEDFDSNRRGWYISQGNSYHELFSDGKYIIENKVNKPLIVTKLLPNKLEQKNDFKIESVITKVNGLDNDSYNIIWGYKDNKNFFTFGVSGDGNYTYGKMFNGKYSILSKKKWFLINNGNSKNKLKIEKTGNKIAFYINDYGVDTQNFQPFMGDYFGFFIKTKMKVEIDNLLVSEVKKSGNNHKLTDLLLDFSNPEITILEPNVRGFEVVSKDELIKVRGIAKDKTGISEVYVNGNPAEVKNNGDFTAFIKLEQGENKINVIAKNKAERITNKTFTISYKKDISPPITNIIRKGKDYGLLFATDNYTYWQTLTNPINDAKSISEELKNNYGFSTELVLNPSKLNIKAKLREYASKTYSDDDQLFIFFAGHGQFDNTYKEGYIVAKDSLLNDEVKDSYISHSELSTIINNIPCKHIFLVMDVCFGGTFDQKIAQRGENEQNDNEITKTEFINRKLKYKTRLYLTSGGKEYVSDGRPGQHSPFARKFLEALRSYGGKDGVLTREEINNSVEKLNPEPKAGEFGNNEPGSDFIFVAK